MGADKSKHDMKTKGWEYAEFDADEFEYKICKVVAYASYGNSHFDKAFTCDNQWYKQEGCLEKFNIWKWPKRKKLIGTKCNLKYGRGKRCEKKILSVRRYVADPDNAYPKRSITKLILKRVVIFDVVSYQFRCALNYSKLVMHFKYFFVADPVNAYPKRSITKLILKGAVIFDVVSYQFRCALNYYVLVRKLLTALQCHQQKRSTWHYLQVVLNHSNLMQPRVALPTEYQLADMFTKALSKDRFQYLVRRIGLRCLIPAELVVLANESA
ncbi:hypothetical protein Tco_0206522 [Tanacetum coccineum]